MNLRLATLEDAGALARFGERTFRETFGPDNRPEDMGAYCRETYGPELQRRELADSRGLTLVLELDGTLAGYAYLREAPPPPCVTGARPIEIARFYLDRHLHGRGLAASLMTATLERARARGATAAWLGVWERNARAIAFYRKHGFEDVGAQPFQLGGDLQTDRVMARALVP